jgi:hypothetical protein
MGRIIATVILVVVLAILVSLNFGFSTSVNLFGKRFDTVSVVAVAALSFAAGVVYSLFIYFGMFLHRRAKQGLANRDRSLTERERKLTKRQTRADRAPDASSPPRSPRDKLQIGGGQKAENGGDGPARSGRSGFAKLRDFFKARS